MDENDPIEGVLRGESMIEPSAGFAHRVMREVHRVAEEPEPLPFPWRLAFGSLVAMGTALVAVFVTAANGIAPGEAAGLFTDLPTMNSDVSIAVWVTIGSLLAAFGITRWLGTGRRLSF